jgi:hypothetical protein
LLEAVDHQRLELSLQPRFYEINNEFVWLERICKNTTMRWLKSAGTIVAEHDRATKTGPRFEPAPQTPSAY